MRQEAPDKADHATQDLTLKDQGDIDKHRVGGGATGMAKLKNLQIRGIQRVNDEEMKSELDLQQEEEALPVRVQERRQTVEVYQVFKEKAKWGEFYRVYGLALFLLGAYFLTVPFYNVIC